MCLSEVHVTEERIFYKAFPNAIRISQFEFDTILFFYPDMQIVQVADEDIENFMNEETAHEETEDKKLISND